MLLPKKLEMLGDARHSGGGIVQRPSHDERVQSPAPAALRLATTPRDGLAFPRKSGAIQRALEEVFASLGERHVDCDGHSA